MTNFKNILYILSYILMGVGLVFAGIMHFAKPEFYLKAMPPYIPAHQLMVDVSGVAEILLGILLLIPKTRRLAAWGIIALLIAVFPANVHMYFNPQDFTNISKSALLIRLPIQLVFILWAYIYTKK